MKVEITQIWQGQGTLLYKTDQSENTSVGILNHHVKDVLYDLKAGQGTTEIAGRVTLRHTQRGITLSDYQGRHLFLTREEIKEAIKLLEEVKEQ